MSKRRADHGDGRLYERSGKFYVQYWIEEHGKRVQRSTFLAEKDDVFYSLKSRALNEKRRAFIAEMRKDVNRTDMRIADFWKEKYLPHITKNKRQRTASAYSKIWDAHLKDHFGDTTLREYSTGQGTNYITQLSDKYSSHTLQHIRAVGSAIFTFAIATEVLGRGALTYNPWRGVLNLASSQSKGKSTPQTQHYTLAEIQEIIAALNDCTVKHENTVRNGYGLRQELYTAEPHAHADAALLMGLTFFCALRPSEAIAVDWQDFGKGYVNVQRSLELDGTVVELTKTKGSIARLPLIEPVVVLLKALHEQCGCPSSGLVFPSSNPERPIDIANLVNRVIKPCLKAHRLTWKGLYSGRRGGATLLVDLTNGLVAAQELLRHKDMTTTARAYKKTTQNALPNGMKLLEAAAGVNA